MKIRKTRSTAWQAVLVLTMMSLSGCAHGPMISTEAREKPSAAYLRSLAHEYAEGVYGPATREAVKDWIARNEPEKESK